jgi:hypothetical protein
MNQEIKIPRSLALHTWGFLAQDCSPCMNPECQILGKNDGVDTLVDQWNDILTQPVEPMLTEREQILREALVLVRNNPDYDDPTCLFAEVIDQALEGKRHTALGTIDDIIKRYGG